jgi:hypothetical protein
VQTSSGAKPDAVDRDGHRCWSVAPPPLGNIELPGHHARSFTLGSILGGH